MDYNISVYLTVAVYKSSGESIDALFTFLDNQIEILSFNLYSELFKKIMRKSWNSVVEVSFINIFII